MVWWTWIGYILVGFYALALFYVLVFCLSQLHLLWLYAKHQQRPSQSPPPPPPRCPPVTVQLPIYNEMYVVERLIRNIMMLDYPRDLLEVQVLDDSNDEKKSALLYLLWAVNNSDAG